MMDKVLRFVEENRLLTGGDRVIVALSGGADSTALIHLICSLKEKYDLRVYAAHFNHMIRGEEADRDEAFVKSLCGSLPVDKLFIKRADVPAIARERGQSLELCGRELRYEYFGSLSGSLGAKIATAHNLYDNSETVLMNLVRGAGFAGLSGIPVARGNIIRPLLCCSRAEIEEYCSQNGLKYVTDSTNLQDEYTRNKLRLNVLPILRLLNPSLDDGIMRTSLIMREAEDHLDNIAFEELKRNQTAYGYSCKGLLNTDRAVLRHAVRLLADRHGAGMDFEHTDAVIRAMSSGGTVDLGKGFSAVCAQGNLRIVDTSAERSAAKNQLFVDYPFKVRLRVAGGAAYTVDGDPEEYCQKINKKFFNNCIPCDIISCDTRVRGRTAGDTFTDPRRKVTKTVKKLLNEMKVPRERRDLLTVVAEGSTVLWLEGVGTSACARVDSDFCGEVFYIISDKL